MKNIRMSWLSKQKTGEVRNHVSELYAHREKAWVKPWKEQNSELVTETPSGLPGLL